MDPIEELLTRGVDSIYPSREELEKVLRSGKKLKLYQGFDPTGTQIHIGHMVGIRKLAQWQKLGHTVIFLIGDGTGQAGDPSGKTTARDTFFTQEELRQNAKDYVLQTKKLIQFDGENPVQILYNGDWLNKLTLTEILTVIENFSLQQLAERDLFQQRVKKGETVNMREFIYPVLQAYDSVAMNIDLELGGSDQIFNMLSGRALVKSMLNKNKFVMATPLLADATGRKIGKSEGNAIAITDKPADLYGKVMGLGDEIIIEGLLCLTDLPVEVIKKIEESLKNGENPVQYKKQLAYEIVKQLNTPEEAEDAQEHFEKTIQRKEMPTDITEVKLDIPTTEGTTIADVLVSLQLATSKAEAKRLIEQGGVAENDVLYTDPNAPFAFKDGAVIRVGKRRFVRIKTS